MPPTNNGSTEDVQPPVVQIQTRNPNPEPNVAPVIPPVPKASIPFPSRRNDERRKEKANDQIEKFYEILIEIISKTVEPSIDEPPEVELKELPPHLEYAFLEGDNKLPVIIAKDLKDEEKAALLSS
ncbi:hypothetical protein Tco_0806471 [Tanacetum coccineum]